MVLQGHIFQEVIIQIVAQSPGYTRGTCHQWHSAFSWIFSGLLSPAGEGGIYTAARAPATVWTSSVCRDAAAASAELAESWLQALSERTLG